MMVEIRIQVAVLWAVLMIVYFIGDLLRVFGMESSLYGTQETRFRQPMRLGISMLMVVPVLMLMLILMLPQPVSRWANIVMTGLILLVSLMGLPNHLGIYDKFLIVVGVILNLVTLWLTWNLAII